MFPWAARPPVPLRVPPVRVVVPVTVRGVPAATDSPPTLTTTFMTAFLLLVASKVATSAAPGTTLPDQLPVSLQLVVAPRPVHVRVAARAPPEARKTAATAAMKSTPARTRP